MTSAISFTKLIRTERKQLMWLTVLQAVAFALSVPLFVLMNMAVALEDQKTAWVDADARVMLEVLSASMGLDRYPDVLLALIFGVIAALGAFCYVHSREKLDFYHSLPLRRDRFFLVRSMAVVETYAGTYALALVCGLLVGGLYHVFSMAVLIETAVTFVRNLLFFCCSYAGTLVAVMLTGKLLTVIVRGTRAELEQKLLEQQPLFSEILPLTLEEIFISETEVAGYDVRNLIY